MSYHRQQLHKMQEQNFNVFNIFSRNRNSLLGARRVGPQLISSDFRQKNRTEDTGVSKFTCFMLKVDTAMIIGDA